MAHGIRLHLRIAARNDDESTRMLAHQTMDGLTAFARCHLRHRARIDEADVGLLATRRRPYTHLLQ